MYKDLLDQIVIAILIPAIPLLGYYLKLWISQQIESLKENQKIDEENQKISRVNFYLDRIEKLIYEVVKSVSQTYVEELKTSGLFGAEAQKEAFRMAKDKISELTMEEGRYIIEEIYGDYYSYLNLKIEEVVNELNKRAE